MYSRLSFSFNTRRRSWTERSRAASKDMMATEGDGLRHARGWDRGVSPPGWRSRALHGDFVAEP